MRSIISIIAIITSFIFVSIVDSPAEDTINPGWDWTSTVYSSEPTNPKLLSIWWEIDQTLSPETVWSVRRELDNFVLERDFNIDQFEHLIPVIRKRLEENYGITGFRIIGAGIEDLL